MSLKRTLYLGLEAPPTLEAQLHYPVIRIVPRSLDSPLLRHCFSQNLPFTHLIVTSKSTVPLLCHALDHYGHRPPLLPSISSLAVGQATASRMQEYGLPCSKIASPETAEGIIDLLKKEALNKAHVLWPHSALSRPLINNFLIEHGAKTTCPVLYDTHPHDPGPLPPSSLYDTLLFTSPSTVNAFFSLHETLPPGKVAKPIGPITAKALLKKLGANRIYTETG